MGSEKQDPKQVDSGFPAWISEDYDENHLDETEPLFGTGTLNLRDDNNDVENPAMKALHHIKNVFHVVAAKTAGGSQNESKTSPTNDKSRDQCPTVATRVGQNLLLRDVIVVTSNSKGSDNDDDDDASNANTENNPFTNTSNNKNVVRDKNCDDTVVNETTKLFDNKKLTDAELYPFGKPEEETTKKATTTATTKVTVDQLKPHRPTHHSILYIFNILQGYSVISGISIIIAQILPICFIQPRSEIFRQIGFVSMALKSYVTIFSLLLIFTEIDLSFFKSIKLLHGYLSRGFIYSFVGLICINESDSDRLKYILLNRNSNGPTADFDWVGVYIEATAYNLLCIGYVYMILGIFCLKRLRDKLKENEISLWKDYREKLKLWKQQQKEQYYNI